MMSVFSANVTDLTTSLQDRVEPIKTPYFPMCSLYAPIATATPQPQNQNCVTHLQNHICKTTVAKPQLQNYNRKHIIAKPHLQHHNSTIAKPQLQQETVDK
jgi:hypothetical protein